MRFLAWTHRARPLQILLRVLLMVVLFLVVAALSTATPITPFHLFGAMAVGLTIGMLMVDNLIMGFAMFLNYATDGTVWDAKREPGN